MNLTSWILIIVLIFILFSFLLNYLLSKKQQLFCVYIKGNERNWSFEFWSKEEYWQEWEDDGLEIHKVLGSSPNWVYFAGLHNIWYWLQRHYIIPLQ
jgi:hypothetical protein